MVEFKYVADARKAGFTITVSWDDKRKAVIMMNDNCEYAIVV